MDTFLNSYVIAVIFTFFFMSIMWFWGKTRNNYAVIDVGWGLVIAGIYSLLILPSNASIVGKLFLLLPVWIWSIRLSGFLYWTRIRTNHPEDKRYADFRLDYGDKIHQKFFTNVFMLQGILALLLSAPALTVNRWYLDFDAGWRDFFFPFFGWILFIIGVLGESISDNQLHSFIKNPMNKGKVCDGGLWKYSRHPNYFFEWVIWLGIGVIPIRDSFSLISLFSPIFMFILLRFVSGVPFAEKYSLKSKGELFQKYQKNYERIFPMVP